MAELRTSIQVNLGGNLSRRAQQYQKSLSRLGTQGAKSIGKIGVPLNRISANLSRLGNRYTALAGGLLSAAVIRRTATLEERLTRLGIQANKTEAEIQGVHREIVTSAQAPTIRADPSEIISAVEEIVEKTGDLDFARKNIENIGHALQATGAAGGSIGGILAEFQKMGIINPKDVSTALDILTVQGKAGAFTLQNLASLGSRVVTAYTAMGRAGVPAIREMGAALQIIRQGTGSSEMAATAFEALLRTLGDAKKVKFLQGKGIKVFDAKALAEGREVLRPINELMVDILNKTGGKKTLLSQVFDAEAVRAFNAAAGELQRTGKVLSLDKFFKVHADGTTIINDSARAAKTANANYQSFQNSLDEAARKGITPVLREVSEGFGSLEPKEQAGVFKGAVVGGGAGALAGAAFAGIGAVPGAIVGAIIGGFSGAFGAFQPEDAGASIPARRSGERPSSGPFGGMGPSSQAPQGKVLIELRGFPRDTKIRAESKGIELDIETGIQMGPGS